MRRAIVLLTICCSSALIANEKGKLTAVQTLEPELSNSMPIRQPAQIKSTPAMSASSAQPVAERQAPKYNAFTGRVVGNGVRLRLQPDVESSIVKELSKDDWVIVVEEKNDFYGIEAPSDMKAYVFRSFVLDNVVEGTRVNVRLQPELNAPVIGHLNTGDKVNGAISDQNSKWLEIAPPKNTRLYVAREFIEKMGGPELKAVRDKKKTSVVQLMESANAVSQAELSKSFDEIDFDKATANYKLVIQDYSDFTEFAEQARNHLVELQECYLQKKISFLEAKANKLTRQLTMAKEANPALDIPVEVAPLTDKMKSWISAEESLFLVWASQHPARSLDDYYQEQRTKAIRVSGILESYTAPIKNKPGNFIIRDRDLPRAYLYSTKVDLEKFAGKYVSLYVASRPNNNFAFPAYFVLDVVDGS
ncbi:MAG: SH3 domain-containing protein [Chlamydiae bacterium]|nr:SH3 domain-containing protein [Chlamydiota bacterium]